MQSPPFRILGINNSNPCHAGNPLPKSSEQGAGAARQLPPILVLNPSARVGHHREDGEGEQRNKSSGSTKKRQAYSGDRAHAAPDTNKTLPANPQLTLMMMAFLQTLLELCMAKQKVRERKRQLQQLLL